MLKQNLRIGLSLALLVLLAAPAFAAGDIIYNGVDIWKTPADGSTWQDFAADPLPSGFFCIGSEPFTGRITFEGLPLITDPPEALLGRDTVIHRLDDAVFNEKGVAMTRVQVAALSLISKDPIETSCGAYEVRAMVAGGEQPVTEMRIERQNKMGGRFEAELQFIAKLTFTSLERPGEKLEIERLVRLDSGSAFFWSNTLPKLAKGEEPRPIVDGFVLIDTDGNDKADTFLPGTTSNFFPYGVKDGADGEKALPIELDQNNCHVWCHFYIDGHCHCNEP